MPRTPGKTIESKRELEVGRFNVFSGEISFQTKGKTDIHDITAQVDKLVSESGVEEGLCCIFVPGATGALTTMEYEPGVVTDLQRALERMAPEGIEYEHHLKWKDGNGHSHVRAALIGPSITVPVKSGKVPTGTWQQIVFIELDVRQRERKLLVHVMGIQ
jgi:secondary thiamine-phosphate synthase enzyme